MRQAIAVNRSDASSGQGGGLRFGETSVRAFQDGPAERLGELAVPGFRAADLIERLGEELHDVEPIHGDGGIVEALANGRDERTTHVADHLDDRPGEPPCVARNALNFATVSLPR